MLANLIVTTLGASGVHFMWTRRHRSGGRLLFDLASSVRHPWFYRFAIGVRSLISDLCLSVGAYRLAFGIVD